VARAKFVEVFDLPAEILGTESTAPSPSADPLVGDAQVPTIQHPVDSFSFGWLDEISVSQEAAEPDTFFVLFPQPNDDPWSTHAPTLTFYRLEVNSTGDVEEGIPLPHTTTSSTSQLFSGTFLASVPLSASNSPTSTSASTSTKLVVGRHHTALWLSPRPRERDSTGLVQMDLYRPGDWPSQASGIQSCRAFLGDDLVWASFGPRRTKAETQTDGDGTSLAEEDDSKPCIFTNRILNSRGEDLTAIRYDEETGRVVLGRRDGHLTFLRL
jgi:hypothetical protein